MLHALLFLMPIPPGVFSVALPRFVSGNRFFHAALNALGALAMQPFDAAPFQLHS
jgi:hypothetical protein